MLYNEFKPSDVAYFQKFFDLFTEKGIFEKRVHGRADALQGVSHGRDRLRAAAAPWTAAAGAAGRAAPKTLRVGQAAARRRAARCCSSSGTSSVRCGFIKPILLPTPRRHARARWSPASPAGRC